VLADILRAIGPTAQPLVYVDLQGGEEEEERKGQCRGSGLLIPV
jgi:hypothetical protein